MKILFICCAGMSSSLLVKKLEDYIREFNASNNNNLNITIEAIPLAQYVKVVNDYDLILLAPQIGYKLKEFKKLLDNKNKHIPIAVVKGMDYGLLRVENILQDSLALIMSTV